ncbi:DNA cytosine methyltransferase [Candidatus Bathyarchaeota archaeon]|nr:DNA cytosine methyltransferase [Candidatus Bathyarchaeota archaeon]
MNFKLLDCFCGLGGVSDGFAMEGFDVLGIDIEDMPAKGYKHKFLRADIRDLKGENFRGYDVIWGSPPCRDFSWISFGFGHRWKRPPQPEVGLELVQSFRKFIDDAQPKFWIMENVSLLTRHFSEKPQFIAPLGKRMHRAFWGNFPPFLFSRTSKQLTKKNKVGKMSHIRIEGKIPDNEQFWRAKIPLACSHAFARACKEKLLESNIALFGSNAK